jgi:integrase
LRTARAPFPDNCQSGLTTALPTLTAAEQKAILRATAANVRDHTLSSMALGTGLRLGELVGLDVGDVYTQDGRPRLRVLIRPDIANGGRRRTRSCLTGWSRSCSGSGGGSGTAARTWQRKAGLDRLHPLHAVRRP